MTIQNLIKKNLEKPLVHIWISVFMEVIGFSIIHPYLPRYFLDMGASLPMIGFYLSINAFIGFFSGIFWGKLSDKYGRRPILIICRIGAMAGYLVLAFSTNLAMLLASRIIDGFFSRSIPVTLTILGDIVPPNDRSKEMSKIGIAWIAGGLVGPGIGAILSVFGLAGPGLFCAGLSVAAAIITAFAIKESNPNIKGIAAVAGLEKTAMQPAFSLGLLKKYNPRVLLSQNYFAMLAHFIFNTTITLYISKRFGLSIGQIGGVLTIIGVINLFVRLLIFPGILRRLGDKKTIFAGLSILIIAFGWLMILNTMWEFIAVSILVSFAITCGVDVMSGVLSKSVSKNEMGEMMGLNSALESITLIFGPIIGSYLISLQTFAFYGLAPALSSIVALLISFIPLRKMDNQSLEDG